MGHSCSLWSNDLQCFRVIFEGSDPLAKGTSSKVTLVDKSWLETLKSSELFNSSKNFSTNVVLVELHNLLDETRIREFFLG